MEILKRVGVGRAIITDDVFDKYNYKELCALCDSKNMVFVVLPKKTYEKMNPVECNKILLNLSV